MSKPRKHRKSTSILKRVLVIFPTTFSSRNHIKGIMRYRREHQVKWALDVREVNEIQPDLLKLTPEYHDGVIGNIIFDGYPGLLKSLAIPAVFVHSDLSRVKIQPRVPWYAYIFADNYAIIKCAVNYMIGRGFSSFAYVGSPDNIRWSEERATAAQHFLSQHGILCHVYPKVSAALARNFSLEDRKLGMWLKSLPPKTAVLAANDQRAEQVLGVCQRLGINIPEELAVLGIDNDVERCEAAVPTLSSIAVTFEEAGFRAAEALDNFFRGADSGRPPDAPFAIPYASPVVIPRESTNERLSSDLLVRRACELINATNGCRVTVQSLLEKLHVSKRSLETHFLSALNCTPSEEIARIRLGYVKKLASDRSLTRTAIADRCGFSSTSHLAWFFRHHTGQTITDFRNSN